MDNNTFSQRPRYSRYFWTPVYLFLGLCVGLALLVLGGYIVLQQWAEDDYADLVVATMQSPSAGLSRAEALLLEDRIDFALYRDLLRTALVHQDADLRSAANQSIANVLGSGRAFADVLKTELAAMPPQVFIMTTRTDAGVSGGQTLEVELKERGVDVVSRKARDPAGISKTQVVCYDRSECKETAQSVVNLLREWGYDVADAKPGDNVEDSAMILDRKRVDVVLADIKRTGPAPSGTVPYSQRPADHIGANNQFRTASRVTKRPKS
jgi:hypothetical protein